MSRYNTGRGSYGKGVGLGDRANPYDFGSYRATSNWNAPPRMGFNAGGPIFNGYQPYTNNNNFNAPMRGPHPGWQGNAPFNKRGGGASGGGGGGGRGRGAGPKSGDKRQNISNKKNAPPQKKPKDSSTAAKTLPPEVEVIIADEDIVVTDELKAPVEKLRQRTGGDDIEVNTIGEDIAKLTVFSFTGKGYHCTTCGLFLLDESIFGNHLTSKNHALKVIDQKTDDDDGGAAAYQGVRDILDIDLTGDDWYEESELARSILFKQAKIAAKMDKLQELRKAAEYDSTPSNFYAFNLTLRKSVAKKDDSVVITSVVESSVEKKDFGEGDERFGCEFIRAVLGYHCRLCSKNIRDPKGIIPHLETATHKSNYSAYIKKNPNVRASLKAEQDEILQALGEHDEGVGLVLSESDDAKNSYFLSKIGADLVRVPRLIDGNRWKVEKGKIEDNAVEGEDSNEAGGSKADEPMEAEDVAEEDVAEDVAEEDTA